MSDLLVCRACLVSNVKLYNIEEYSLRDTYERVTNTKIVNRDELPQHLCSYCVMSMNKALAFLNKCAKAEEVIHWILGSSSTKKINQELLLSFDRVSVNLTYPYAISEIQTTSYQREIEDGDSLLGDSIIYLNTPQNDMLEENNDGFNDELQEHDQTEIKLDSNGQTKRNHSKQGLDVTLEPEMKSRDDDEIGRDEKSHDENAPEPCLSQGQASPGHITVIRLSRAEQAAAMRAKRRSRSYLRAAFPCQLCYKGFTSEATYNNHMKQHSESAGTFLCDVCHTRWGSSALLRAHRAAVHETRYACSLCRYSTMFRQLADQHLEWHSGKKYECEICGETFTKSTSHLSHMRLSHAGALSQFRCQRCGQAFLGQAGLQVHREEDACVAAGDKSELSCSGATFREAALGAHTHTDSCGDCSLAPCECGGAVDPASCRRLQCTECPQTFSSVSTLKGHQRVHARRRRRHVCEVCGRNYVSRGALQNHQRVHTGEKPFRCDVCDKRFGLNESLKLHKRTHTDERPCKCPVCPKAFRHSSALHRHSKVHTGAKPYACPHCEKSFSQSNSMKVHVATVHMRLPPPYSRRKRGSVA